MRQVIEIKIAVREILTKKTLPLVSINRGRYCNHRFDRAQAVILWMVKGLNAEKFTCVNIEARTSVQNPLDCCIPCLNHALYSDASCRIISDTNIEKHLLRKKGAKDLMNSYLSKKTQKAQVKSVTPIMKQLE